MRFKLFKKEMPELGRDIVLVTELNGAERGDMRITTGEFALLDKGSFQRYIVEGEEDTTYISEHDITEGNAAWAYTEDLIAAID